METVIRNVGEIDVHDRQSLEHVLGRSLSENQQLVINIVNLQVPVGTAPDSPKVNGTAALPGWCNVYEGLSDDEIATMEQTILQRADLSRPSE
ncbi:MAG: hypothetical protein JSS49_09750 [Planctomycetes bacterium]|nr:hypothetical protein [Planctomycetota bacterium]